MTDNPNDISYYTNPLPPNDPHRFEQVEKLMAKLRAPDGCPWDKEQTLDTLQQYVTEEAEEVVQAMKAVSANPTKENWAELCEEVGDLILECLFVAQFGSEANEFNIYDSLEMLRQKLVRRHPHVFGDTKAITSDEVLENWVKIKQTEVENKKSANSNNQE